MLELEERGSARVSGVGFLPGTPVYGVPGEHTLQVNGTNFDGLERSANLGVVVNAAVVPALPSTGADLLGVWVLSLALFGLGLILTVRPRPDLLWAGFSGQ